MTKQDYTCLTCNTQFAPKKISSSRTPKYCKRECYDKARMPTQSEFIISCQSVHGASRYDYTNTLYAGMHKKINIYCNRCSKVFSQKAKDHKNGRGCTDCYLKDRFLTISEFIERAVKLHGLGRYDYSKSVYVGYGDKIQIGCNDCGTITWQKVASHLDGHGCPQCAFKDQGYSRSDFIARCEISGRGLLYVIRCYDNETAFYKIGITSQTIKDRFHSKHQLPYEYEVCYEITGEASYIYDLEIRMHSLLRLSSYKPDRHFKGYTECFSTIKPIEKLLKELESTEQLQLIA